MDDTLKYIKDKDKIDDVLYSYFEDECFNMPDVEHRKDLNSDLFDYFVSKSIAIIHKIRDEAKIKIEEYVETQLIEDFKKDAPLLLSRKINTFMYLNKIKDDAYIIFSGNKIIGFLTNLWDGLWKIYKPKNFGGKNDIQRWNASDDVYEEFDAEEFKKYRYVAWDLHNVNRKKPYRKNKEYF